MKSDHMEEGSIVYSTGDCPNLLEFKPNGDVVYKGKFIGNDDEILGIVKVALVEFNKSIVCECCGKPALKSIEDE